MKFLQVALVVFVIALVHVVLATSSDAEAAPRTQLNVTEAASFPETKGEESVRKWIEADKVARKFSATLVKNILPLAVRWVQDINLSSSCQGSLMKFLTGIKQLKTWAYQMLDSSGKVPNGLFSGNINSLGDYDECLATEVPGHFQGQYCLLDVTPPLPERRRFVSSDLMLEEFVNVTDPKSATTKFMQFAHYYYHLKFRSSICVPSTCTATEIQEIAVKAMEHIGINFNVNIPNCEIKTEKVVFTTSEISIVIILSLLLFLGISATITDVALKLRSEDEKYQSTLGLPVKCLLCFSFYTNTVRLLKEDNSQDSIKIFHGMKVITILWVILNHTYYYINFQAFGSLLNARQMGREKAFQLVANGFLNVETFFFISAVLVAYGTMKMKEEKLNVFLYIFRRLWRLTPPFMFVIATVYLLPHLGSGPVWKETVVDGLSEKCKLSWWKNLLYINNFIPNTEMCLQWTWYIPVDTHLYFISLLVLIPLKKSPKFAFFMNGVMFVSGIVISAISNVYYGLHPTAIYVYNHPEDIDYFTERGYFRTYLHCSTYCVGLTIGYVLATRKNLRIPLLTNLSCWLIAVLMALTVLYGVHDWNQGNVPGIVVSTIFTCTNKLVWSLALAWVTFSCMTGNGGIATTILSWKPFVPLGRLTYMAYLVHPIIQLLYIGSTRTLITAEHRSFVYMFLGNIVLAFVCAYVFSLLFESPFMALEKVLFTTRHCPSEKQKSEKGDVCNMPKDEKQLDGSYWYGDNPVCTIKIKHIEANDC